MLPEMLLRYSVQCGRIAPQWLAEGDHPWLRALLDEFEAHVGRPQRELEERLREPLSTPCPRGKMRLASHVLWRLWGRTREQAPRAARGRAKSRRAQAAKLPRPRVVRSALFFAGAGATEPREETLTRVSADLETTPPILEATLFGDLPGERRLGPATAALSPADLAQRVNLALAQALLFRSTEVRVALRGSARPVVRHARWKGLICTVTPGAPEDLATLSISGPYVLFRRTLLYGRALGELLPVLAWCNRYYLQAECVLRGQHLELTLASGDPIAPSMEPRRFDSRLEERFARELRKLTTEWDVVREPEPIAAGDTLVFPDFSLQHRPTGRSFLLELAGFWTPGYLEKKLRQYRAAQLSNLILCIDEDLNCAPDDLPPGTPVLRFRRRVDAAAVLRLVEEQMSAQPGVAGAPSAALELNRSSASPVGSQLPQADPTPSPRP